MLATAMLLALTLQDGDAVGALVKEYQKAERDWMTARRAAKTPEEQKELAKKAPGPLYLPKFRQAAKVSQGESAAEALSWTFRLGNGMRGDKDGAAAAEEAAKTLLANHADSPKLEQVAGALEYSKPAWAKGWLREAADKARDPKAKAAAMFSLAVHLGEGKATKSDRDQAVALLKTVSEKFADTPSGKRAGPQLFEMENLQIGCTVPDFEAKDVDGVSFKLSDYRGKVVVLDFWGFW